MNWNIHCGLLRLAVVGLLTLLTCAVQSESKNGFQLDEALVPVNEIHKGGPARDGIPSLDHPKFVAASDADYLKDKDRILGISIKGVARAYPIRILNYHEIVNDVVGGQALAVTYCPLCGSGTAFAATVDGKTLEFGVSGLLYNSDVLMYDRLTGSLWSQLLRQAVTGPMKGESLQLLPIANTTWHEWTSRHPYTRVLSADTGYRRNYAVSPYRGYSRDRKLYFPVAHDNDAYNRKEIVMGLELDNQFKAYPFKELRRGAARFQDEFSGQQFAVEFDAKNDSARILAADGAEIPTITAFWFAWYAFHPDTAIYKAP